jgi:hypothetical protein
MSPTAHFRGGARLLVLAASVAASLALVLASPLAAQVRPGSAAPVPELQDDHGTRAPRPRAFSLFGNADAAVGALRYSGVFSMSLTNFEPCQNVGPTTIVNCAITNRAGVARQQLFMWTITAAAGISDFRKIRTVYPGVNNMVGPAGYTYLSTGDIVGAPRKWGPADGALGRAFSGVTSEVGGAGCRSKSGFFNGYINLANLTLLAHSDCPQTWVGSRYDGIYRIPEESYRQVFGQNAATFNFDPYGVPRSMQDTTKSLGSFATYAEYQDYTRDLLPQYGAVTPHGTGPAQLGGYPLGLDVRIDMFNFNQPELTSVIFYQMTVVNNSDRVYGSGIDYDSLYFGFSPGYIQNTRGIYYDPARNTVWGVLNGRTANCNNSAKPTGVQGCNVAANGGFNVEDGIATVILRSPIGDERNKLLSKVGGPFYSPTSPFRDDTITFNQGHHCGFGPDCSGSTIQANTRRGYGMFAGREADVLDGRDPATFTPIQMWRTFRSKNFVGDVNPAAARFNRFVPGATLGFGEWDYNNDGIQDTLFLDTCADQGCVAPMADTMPGKQTIGYSNIDGLLGAGPFALKHKDTTTFVFAWTAASDSVSLANQVQSARQAYMNFFLGPEPPPTPRISSAQVRSTQVADAQNVQPEVRITFSGEPEEWVDPFLAAFADQLESATDSARIILRTLNPNLVAEVRAAARLNFADLLIYKSCDNGQTFTSDNDCDGDPTTTATGASATLPWAAYGRLVADANGQIDNVFTDANVQGGRTYLYSLVPRAKGFRRAVTIRNAGSPVQRDTILVISDTLAAVIARSGPSTATVYVPVSLPAGANAPEAVVATVGGDSRLAITTRVGQGATTGPYRLVFANRFTVTIRTTIRTGDVSSTVVARDAYASARVDGGAPVTNFAVDSVIFSGSGRVDFSGITPTFTTTTDGITRTETATFSTTTPSAVLAGTDGRPYFITNTLTAAGTTPANFLGRTDFPGFVLELVQANSTVLASDQVIEPDGDSLVAAVRNSSAVQYVQASSTQRNGFGVYQFRFASDAFGPGAPFTLGTPQATSDAVLASLAARPATSTASTDANAIATVRATLPELASAKFAAIKFPFTVTSSRGRPLILVAAERTSLPSPFSSIVVGSASDTVRVTPPVDTWVPGDPFYLLEEITRDSVNAGATVIGDTTINGATVKRPIQVRDTVVAFGPLVLGCETVRVSCNPVAFGTRGATGYLPFTDGWRVSFDYPEPFTLASEYRLDVRGPQTPAGRIASSVLRQVRVVPNPYVVLSDFDAVTNRVGESRVLFTGVPPTGSLRIYSVSGQFLQQLAWNESDLNGTGDLAYNLRTREGTDLASGLYIYVLTPGGANAGSPVTRGKFTVIR